MAKARKRNGLTGAVGTGGGVKAEKKIKKCIIIAGFASYDGLQYCSHGMVWYTNAHDTAAWPTNRATPTPTTNWCLCPTVLLY